MGGAWDKKVSKIVSDYADAQANNGDRTVGYFGSSDTKGVVEFAKDNADNGEPLNIIGHSHGASTAVSATKKLAKDGVTVDNLVGVDPVRRSFRRGDLGDAQESVGQIVTVNATGSGTSGDAVESAGKFLGGLTTLGKGTPNAFNSSDAINISSQSSHGDFGGAFETPGADGRSARDIVDASYD